MTRATFTIAVAFLCATAAALASDPKPDEVAGQGSPLSAAALRGWIKPDELTPEERALLDKDAIMQLYHPDEHSRHFAANISKAGDGKDATPVLCFVFGMEDAEPARKEGESMAQAQYSRFQAEEFLYLEGWDKYHDRFFTRCYVQEGEAAYDKAAATQSPPAKQSAKSHKPK